MGEVVTEPALLDIATAIAADAEDAAFPRRKCTYFKAVVLVSRKRDPR